MDFAIAAFKFVGIVLTGVFGVYGLLVKFKTDDGAVTKAGRIALILIIIATIVAVGSHSLEITKQAQKQRADDEARAKEAEAKAEARAEEAEARVKETQEEVKRARTLLAEIKRGLHPIKNVRISYQIDVPTKHFKFEGYVRRFKIGAEEISPRISSEESVPGIVDKRLDADGYVEAFDFNSTSQLAPGAAPVITSIEAGIIAPTEGPELPPIEEIEQLPIFILHHVDLYMQLYRNPIEVDDHPWLRFDSDLIPDLSLFAGSELSGEPPADHGPHQIHYEVKTEQFQIRAQDLPSNPRYWESSGAIVAVPDFVGAQLFITLPSQIRTGGQEIEKHRRELQRKFELKHVVLDIADGFRLSLSNFTKRKDNNGYPVFIYTFPATMDKLLDLCR